MSVKNRRTYHKGHAAKVNWRKKTELVKMNEKRVGMSLSGDSGLRDSCRRCATTADEGIIIRCKAATDLPQADTETRLKNTDMKWCFEFVPGYGYILKCKKGEENQSINLPYECLGLTKQVVQFCTPKYF